jgi:TPR repeat protein
MDMYLAVIHYRLSADQGNAIGQWKLGECLELGLGLQRDVT